MDFENAVNLAPEVEKAYPGVVVTGVRRMSYTRADSWAIDIVNPRTGQLLTLDEKDDWEVRMREMTPEASN